MERWYKWKAGWDEINKGKDSPVMVQDKGVDVQASGEQDNKQVPKGKLLQKLLLLPQEGILGARTRNECSVLPSILTASLQLTNIEGVTCMQGQG
jgi:hypothetical protein